MVRLANALLICSLAALPASGQTSTARASNPKTRIERPPASHVTTSHLTIDAGTSESEVAPGGRVSLLLDIVPRRRMHVYAAGATGYRVYEGTTQVATGSGTRRPARGLPHFHPDQLGQFQAVTKVSATCRSADDV